MKTVSLGNDVRFRSGHFEPATVSRTTEPHSLPQAVEAAVGNIDFSSLKPVTGDAATAVFESRTMLALLTFCYARQVYSSKTIAAQLRRDFSFRMSGRPVPDAGKLQQFRACNRAALDFCLRSALLFLEHEKIRQGVVTHVKEAHIVEEASRRIVMAMFTDSLELEHECQPEYPLVSNAGS